MDLKAYWEINMLLQKLKIALTNAKKGIEDNGCFAHIDEIIISHKENYNQVLLCTLINKR